MKKIIAIIMLFAATSTVVLHAQATLPVSFQAQMKTVLTEYLELKDAFLKTDLESVHTEGAELLEAANAMKTDGLTKAQLNVFKKNMSKVVLNSEHISEAPTVEHCLEHFDYVSEAVYALAKYFDVAEDSLYYDYCPMANGGDGAHWVSDKKEMNNPYLKGTIMGCEKQEDVF